MPKNKKLIPPIIFEDTHLIVISKPAGLLSQGAKEGEDNVVDWLRGYLGRNYVGLVHRLDRNVSGLMVVGKRSKSAARLTAALQNKTLRREYAAWVFGALEKPFRWEHHLEKDEQKNISKVVSKGGKLATLQGRPLGSGRWKNQALTLVEFVLDTGRSHQIRVQAAAEGHPLLGDDKYGGALVKKAAFKRPALHSCRLEFPHPMSQEILTFEDPLPEDLSDIKVIP